MHEVWLDIVGVEGFYQVSNLGRVRSLDRQRHTGHGYYKVLKGKIIKQTLKRNGYLYVGIVKPGVKGGHKAVHRLVLKTFSPRPDMDGLQVNHRNGIKTDNRIENLEWCTVRENSLHAYYELGQRQITKWRT